MATEVLKGHVDVLLLAALQAGPAHGYAIVESVRARSGGSFDLAEGTVYPALYRLERRGLVASTWEAGETGRRRRVYRLTANGAKELGRERTSWDAYVATMGAALA